MGSDLDRRCLNPQKSMYWGFESPSAQSNARRSSFGILFPSPAYDVTADGKRFVLFSDGGEAEAPAFNRVNVVLNWFDEVRELAPHSKRFQDPAAGPRPSETPPVEAPRRARCRSPALLPLSATGRGRSKGTERRPGGQGRAISHTSNVLLSQ